MKMDSNPCKFFSSVNPISPQKTEQILVKLVCFLDLINQKINLIISEVPKNIINYLNH